MLSLFALQSALMRVWLASFGGFGAGYPAEHGLSLAEQNAAAGATRELERIVRAHASARREGAKND